jgi:hypothetical protein
MVQGVPCPNSRPQHAETLSMIDFGPNFADLSRTHDDETEKETAKNNVELLGNFFLVIVSGL